VAERPLRLLGDRCLQHESDHLRGELFIDRPDPPVRGAVMRTIANLA